MNDTQPKPVEDPAAEMLADLFEHPAWPLVLAEIDREVGRTRAAFFSGGADDPEFGGRAMRVHSVVYAFRSFVSAVYLRAKRPVPADTRALLG